MQGGKQVPSPAAARFKSAEIGGINFLRATRGPGTSNARDGNRMSAGDNQFSPTVPRKDADHTVRDIVEDGGPSSTAPGTPSMNPPSLTLLLWRRGKG